MPNNFNSTKSSSLNLELLSYYASLSNTSSHFLLEAIEQGNTKVILNFADDALENLDLKEVMQRFSHLVKSLSTPMMFSNSSEAVVRASVLLRKLIYRALREQPQLLDETAQTSIKNALTILENDSPIRVEFLMI